MNIVKTIIATIIIMLLVDSAFAIPPAFPLRQQQYSISMSVGYVTPGIQAYTFYPVVYPMYPVLYYQVPQYRVYPMYIQPFPRSPRAIVFGLY